MILQSLNQYYDRLVEAGTLERPGWQSVKVSYALQIDDAGSLVRVLPLMHESQRGKKTFLAPRMMNLPAQVKRAVDISPNFLCDNASYLLGMDDKGKPERTRKCFLAASALHEKLLGELSSKPARAILMFFKNWNPDIALEHSAIQDYRDDLLAGVNITFAYEHCFANECQDIQRAWDQYYNALGSGERMRCLVTGERTVPARIHPSIKGVVGGQPVGTTLVSFNASAFESFGRDGAQGMNAPVSGKAAFAYSAAINYMIATERHHFRLSDATVVFWAENAGDAYTDFMSAALGMDEGIDENDLYEAMRHIAAGRSFSWQSAELNPEERFYILGLAPNAARLSVRFFLQNSFERFAANLQRHQEQLKIIRPNYDQRKSLTIRQLLDETVNPNARDKTPSPLLSGSMVRSVLMGLPYPVLILEQTMLRIRAEHRITRGRAAIIKAFLLRNTIDSPHFKQYEEALNVELNENSNYQPYLLGRLFAVLEDLQMAANPGINTTIRDRFFNAACATPGVVFPQLIKLAQAHLKKLEGGLPVVYNKQIGGILSRFDTDYPTRLSLYDQGVFQLGYYHQVQARYTKKEEKKNV